MRCPHCGGTVGRLYRMGQPSPDHYPIGDEWVVMYPQGGPGSTTCDKAGATSIADCKDCWGTGGCRHGKTDAEWEALCKKRGGK